MNSFVPSISGEAAFCAAPSLRRRSTFDRGSSVNQSKRLSRRNMRRCVVAARLLRHYGYRSKRICRSHRSARTRRPDNEARGGRVNPRVRIRRNNSNKTPAFTARIIINARSPSGGNRTYAGYCVQTERTHFSAETAEAIIKASRVLRKSSRLRKPRTFPGKSQQIASIAGRSRQFVNWSDGRRFVSRENTNASTSNFITQSVCTIPLQTGDYNDGALSCE